MKNFKTFYDARTASRPKKILQLPTRSLSYVSGTKTFLRRFTRIYIHLLWEGSFWAFRNGVVQMFFLTPTKNMFGGKFVKWAQKHALTILSESSFVNLISFLAKLCCKMSDLFFLLTLTLRHSTSTRKSKIIRPWIKKKKIGKAKTCLTILTEKKHPQIKLQRLEKVRIWCLGCW